MKSLLLFTLSLSWTCLASSAEIVFSERREADSFKRISEYFSGKENPGRYAIARTDPEERTGYYIALKLEESVQPESIASLRLQFVRPSTLEIESKTLAFAPIKKRLALIGLTDGDWSKTRAVPNAWKIEFLDAAGNAVSQAQSFLWAAVTETPSQGK